MTHPTRVLVTGATGFIASHIVEQLLAKGYHVRGTVRSLSKTAALAPLRAMPGAEDRLELVAADLNTEGAFDEATRDCTYVIHTASPYVLSVNDAQTDLVDPAVNGTLRVLSACRQSPGITRVVLTSSMAAITDEPSSDHVLTEADWNTKSTLHRNPYYLSKTLAEKAAWEFMTREAPGFSLVAINPFMVIGPSFTPTLNTSNQVFVDLSKGAYPGIMHLAWGFVDVRDVADAHIRAMELPQASGRYLCAGDVVTMRELVTLLRDNGWGEGAKLPTMSLPDWVVKLSSYTQKPGVGSYLRSHVGRTPRYSAEKIQRELGMTFRPAAAAILDTMHDLKRWGHI